MIISKTNVAVENLFKHKKADKSMLNEPIIDYIKGTYQVNIGLKQHFLDELLKTCQTEMLVLYLVYKKQASHPLHQKCTGSKMY